MCGGVLVLGAMTRLSCFGAGRDRWTGLLLVLLLGCSTRTAVGPSTQSQPLRSCVVPARPKASISLQPVFPNLTFDAPVALVQARRQAGQTSGRWFLVDQHGEVVSFFTETEGDVGAKVTDVVRSSLRDRVAIRQAGLDERGLLGLALHPKFPEDPRVFVTYTAEMEGLVSRVSSFVVAGGALQPDSEVVLLTVAQPYSNHNGGGIAFGPDGFLYTSLGDGGYRADPQGNGQNVETLLGDLLRIGVDGASDTTLPATAGRNYTIPSDNPFATGGGAKEIYAYGLRNAWRFSFDRETGALWLGDVGQDAWEEIDIIERGGNYGWNVMEGFECFPPEVGGCNKDGLKLPVHVYAHGEGDGGRRSVTGGYVYRGAALSQLSGSYVYADYMTGEIWQLVSNGSTYVNRLLLASNLNVASFGEDQAGELYVLDWSGARVLRVAPGTEGPDHFPKRLSETQCVDVKSKAVTKRAVPYEVTVPFWSDGAQKGRYLVLPRGKHLELNPSNEAQADLVLPPGGMAIKTFERGGAPLETRFYVRHEDGEYSGYTYAWRPDGSDADLVETTKVEERGGGSWVFPGIDACNQCHTAGAGRTLGLTLPQLSRDLRNNPALQALLSDEARTALLNLPESLQPLLALGEPSATHSGGQTDAGSEASVEVRARAYLDVNCSGCHRPGGTGRAAMDLRFATPLADTGLCDLASLGALETQAGKLVAPGSAHESVVFGRITRRDREAMPPLGSLLVDEQGKALIERWINALERCP